MTRSRRAIVAGAVALLAGAGFASVTVGIV
jgi:hypothetical protein